jgi:hypothetical protein
MIMTPSRVMGQTREREPADRPTDGQTLASESYEPGLTIVKPFGAAR